MQSLSSEQVFQVVIGVIGLVMFLGFIDLKRKIQYFDKLPLLDSLITNVQGLVDRLNVTIGRVDVFEASMKLEIEYLKERISKIEQSLDDSKEHK